MITIPTTLIYILASCFIISLIALLGFVSLFFAREFLERAINNLVVFAAGTLIGGAFFHLLPESIEQGGPVFIMAVAGIVFFFSLEVFIYSYHRHSRMVHTHERLGFRAVGTLSLLGDAIHNITDGIAIASSFLISTNLGIVTAIIAASHEIPQEIGDFAILIHSGYSRTRALILNYLAALTIIIGAVGFYIFSERIENLTAYTIPFAAGGFIYIATADLLAEIKEESASFRIKLLQLIIFIFGIVLLWLLKVWSD